MRYTIVYIPTGKSLAYVNIEPGNFLRKLLMPADYPKFTWLKLGISYYKSTGYIRAPTFPSGSKQGSNLTAFVPEATEDMFLILEK